MNYTFWNILILPGFLNIYSFMQHFHLIYINAVLSCLWNSVCMKDINSVIVAYHVIFKTSSRYTHSICGQTLPFITLRGVIIV
jgi:hypothetical protein